MKTSIGILLFAVILYATPHWLFPVCDSVTMTCHHTLSAESWLALILLAAAVIHCFWRPAIHLLLPIAALIPAFPLFITGVCRGDQSPCHLGTRPALITLGICLALFYTIVLVGGWQFLSHGNGVRPPRSTALKP